MRLSTHNIFTDLVSVLFIFLFTYTAVSKIVNIHNFIYTLSKSPLLSSHAVLIAWTIIVTELAIVLILLYPPWRLGGLYSSSILMLLFSLYIGYMILSSGRLPCSCGGILKQLSWKSHFIVNISLTLLATLCLYIEHKKVNRIRFDVT